MWATLELRSSGVMSQTDQLRNRLPIGYSFPNLGPQTYADDQEEGFTLAYAAAQVEVVGHLEPAGVNQVLDPNSPGWEFTQFISDVVCDNGEMTQIDNNKDDSPATAFQWLTPGSDDQVYYIDGPTAGLGRNVNHTKEVTDDFLAFASWNGERGSMPLRWSYQATIDVDVTDLKE